MTAGAAIQESFDMVSAARTLITSHDDAAPALWPRVSSFLGRQAIEHALSALWASVSPGLESETWRTQFLCLPFLLGDMELGARASATWHQLTTACHVRIYEVAPTADEVETWLQSAWEFAEGVAALCERMSPSAP